MIEKSVVGLQNISKIWCSVGIEDKQNLQLTLFPDGIYYNAENHTYLTKKINSFMLLYKIISTNCEVKKIGINQKRVDLSRLVELAKGMSNQLVDELIEFNNTISSIK